MDRNPIVRKGLVFTIIVLFVVISILPNGFSLSMEKDMRNIQVCENGLRDDNDTTPPVTTVTTDPSEPIYNGWYRIGVGVTLNATDNESGVNVTYYQINNERWETYTDTILLWTDGILIVQFYSVDNAGNEETPKQVEIKIDGTPPIIYCFLDPPVPNGLNGWYVSDVWLTLNATDNESGVWRIYCSLSPGGIYTEPVLITGDGSYSFKVSAIDNVGNIDVGKTIPPIKIDKTKPTIAMEYVAEKTGMGQYQIIVTVTASDAMSGMDRVEFYYNEVLQATVSGPGPTYIWNYAYAPIPHVTIKAIAYDEAGNYDYKEIVDPTSYENLQSQNKIVVKEVNQ